MERLGGSEYGAQLVTVASNAGEKGIEWVLKDVAQKFEAFGTEASQYFESRARLLSVIVGFVLAFVINVNAFTLFDTFMTRPDVRNAVIAQGDKVSEKYKTLDGRVSTINASSPTSADEARASVQQAANEATAAVKDLKTLGVPIGWSATNAAEFEKSFWTSLTGLLLGGLLIGLGAPFWYKAVQTLTGVRSLARGKDKESSDVATSTTIAAPTSAPNQPPATPIDAFHAALGATLATGELRAPEEAVG
jgi:hypothetical protein